MHSLADMSVMRESEHAKAPAAACLQKPSSYHIRRAFSAQPAACAVNVGQVEKRLESVEVEQRKLCANPRKREVRTATKYPSCSDLYSYNMEFISSGQF